MIHIQGNASSGTVAFADSSMQFDDAFATLAFPTVLFDSPLILMLVAYSLSVAGVLLSASVRAAPAPSSTAAAVNPLPDYIGRNLGPYSPYYNVGSYVTPPVSCSIDQAGRHAVLRFSKECSLSNVLTDGLPVQVNILQRHGARFPTSNAGKKISASVSKLKNAKSLGSSLAFVKDYTYALGADDLTPLGAEQSHKAGYLAAQRYGSLLHSTTALPFVRSDSSQRVVDCACPLAPI